MNSAIGQVLSKRMWFVPGVTVWGEPNEGEIDFLAVEEDSSSQAIFYGTAGIGAALQEIRFSDLTDHRGNTLPSSIDTPRVLPRTSGADPVFVVSEETANGFKVARSPDASGPVIADFLIIELGS